MATFALYSNKGGVGKTTTAVNLSYLAARSGIKTLICDLDPQSSTSYYFRVKPKLKPGAKGFKRWRKSIGDSIKGTDYENLDLLPADFTHRNLDVLFFNRKRSNQRLRRIVKPLEKDYELIVFDCPVTVSTLAENILNTVDFVLVPLIPTTLSARAFRQLLSFCEREKYNQKKIYAFFSMVDKRKKMHGNTMAIMRKKFKRILPNTIPYLSAIEKMGIEREPVPVSLPRSSASDSYRLIWASMRNIVLPSANDRI